jgi:alkylhydroperoxidase/carboxymuconolactone decarboxylase family protein YurZ
MQTKSPGSHLAGARENGVKREELSEADILPAFFQGWPDAMTLITVAGEVLRGKMMFDSAKCACAR